MKASELIKILERTISEYGDVEVEIPKTDNCYYGHTKIKSVSIDYEGWNKVIIELEG